MRQPELPRFDKSPAAWLGPEMARHPERWTWELTPGQVADLDEAVARLDGAGRDIVSITAADAPLPHAAARLAEVKRDLLFGIGFCLIRGVPVERYTLRQAAIAFWCLGAHLGEAVSQNARGHALGHVRDLGFDYSKPSARGYQTSERLPYHADMGDVVGLLSLRTGRSGVNAAPCSRLATREVFSTFRSGIGFSISALVMRANASFRQSRGRSSCQKSVRALCVSTGSAVSSS